MTRKYFAALMFVVLASVPLHGAWTVADGANEKFPGRKVDIMQGDRLVGLLSSGDLDKATISEQDFTIRQHQRYIIRLHAEPSQNVRNLTSFTCETCQHLMRETNHGQHWFV